MDSTIRVNELERKALDAVQLAKEELARVKAYEAKPKLSFEEEILNAAFDLFEDGEYHKAYCNFSNLREMSYEPLLATYFIGQCAKAVGDLGTAKHEFSSLAQSQNKTYRDLAIDELSIIPQIIIL